MGEVEQIKFICKFNDPANWAKLDVYFNACEIQGYMVEYLIFKKPSGENLDDILEVFSITPKTILFSLTGEEESTEDLQSQLQTLDTELESLRKKISESQDKEEKEQIRAEVKKGTEEKVKLKEKITRVKSVEKAFKSGTLSLFRSIYGTFNPIYVKYINPMQKEAAKTYIAASSKDFIPTLASFAEGIAPVLQIGRAHV